MSKIHFHIYNEVPAKLCLGVALIINKVNTSMTSDNRPLGSIMDDIMQSIPGVMTSCALL
jgi:hypothetical protein